MAHVIDGMELAVKVCEALGLDPNRVVRIVLDLNGNRSPIKAYVEMVGDERLLDIQWTFKGAKIIIQEETSKQ